MTGHTAAVTDVTFGPAGGRIVSRSDDHTLRLWDAESASPVGPPMNGHNVYTLGVAFSPDGQLGRADRRICGHTVGGRWRRQWAASR